MKAGRIKPEPVVAIIVYAAAVAIVVTFFMGFLLSGSFSSFVVKMFLKHF